METDRTGAGLDEIEAVRRKVRADVHPVSTPLLAVGAGFAVLIAGFGDPRSGSAAALAAWLLAPPALFLLLARLERRRAERTGASGPAGAYTRTAAVLAVLLVVGGPVLLFFGPYLLAGLALVALGLATHRPRLAGWAAVLGVMGTAESFYAFSNRWSGSYLPWLHDGVLLAVAALFILAGLYERARERE